MVNTSRWDLRPFVSWIHDEFLPSAKVGTGAARYAQRPGVSRASLYGTGDAACILHTIDKLDTKASSAKEWIEELSAYQDAGSGYFVADIANLAVAHNTGFAVAALNLFDSKLVNGVLPRHSLSFANPIHDWADAKLFADSLDWRSNCYEAGEILTGLAATFVNVAKVVPATWLTELFDYCEKTKLNQQNGMMGVDKPAAGDKDQIGGTFHFDFLWASQGRRLPLPDKRATALLGLQQRNGLWDEHNPWWLTFDGVYMLGRAQPELTEAMKKKVTTAVKLAVDTLAPRALDAGQRKADFVDAWMGVHMLTGAVSFFAYAQQLLGREAVVTEKPLRLVLDRRPYI